MSSKKKIDCQLNITDYAYDIIHSSLHLNQTDVHIVFQYKSNTKQRKLNITNSNKKLKKKQVEKIQIVTDLVRRSEIEVHEATRTILELAGFCLKQDKIM